MAMILAHSGPAPAARRGTRRPAVACFALAAGTLTVAGVLLMPPAAVHPRVGLPNGAAVREWSASRTEALLPNPAVAPASPGAGPGGATHTPITYGDWGAGFVADAPSGEAFTALSARFIAPAAPQPGATGWVAIWGGIGLAAPSGDELMQAGVSLQSTGTGAWQTTIPWWIDEPRAPTEPHVMALVVRPGDTVEVDLGRAAGGQWAFRVTDMTTGAAAVGSCTGCHSDGQTAAWIVEDPTASSRAGRTGFANPGSVVFLHASAALDSGHAASLGRLDWHPLIRAAGGLQQAPGGAPGVGGAFTVADAGTGVA